MSGSRTLPSRCAAFLGGLAIFSFATPCFAEDESLRVLGDDAGRILEERWMEEFYTRVEERKEAYEQIESRADCLRWQEERREFFLEAIANNKDLTDHMEDAISSLRIVLAADEAFRTGKTIDL